MQTLNLAFIGNPNCGKTTLFNAYTGANLKVANWAGVTIEKKEEYFNYNDIKIKVTDLPGIYSLNSYSIEEKVSREYIEKGQADIIIDIVDASSLERNLYLALQLIETGQPIILALNMMDIVKKRGMRINIKKLEEMLKVKIVPISAKNRSGLDELLETAIKLNQIEKKSNIRVKIDNEEEITKKYDYIEQIVNECIENKKEKEEITDEIDKILTHRILGLPIFILIMAIVFLLTFTIGDFIKGYFELLLEMFSDKVLYILQEIGAGKAVTSLIIEGIISGVGGILTFLPNIFILFLCLAFLEDSGYMARASYIMNGIMEKLGLSGKACIPMILGFGCSVPAVMSTRTLKSEKDRKKTIMLIPCMSCSAKIPIYVLFSGMFFGKYGALASLNMYLIGVLIAIIIGIITHKIDKKSRREKLIVELPEYKMPDITTVRKYVWDKIKDYLEKAGTIIFIASIILWGVLNIGPTGFVENAEESYGAIIGKILVPILKPAGLGYWQIAVALISGLAAKEVVVSSINVLYGIEIASKSIELYSALNTVGFTSLNAICLMIFCLLYVPCIATIATIRNETKSNRFTIKIILFQMLLAWVVTTLTYQMFST